MLAELLKVILGIKLLGLIILLPDSQPSPVSTGLLCLVQSIFKEGLANALTLKFLENIEPLDFIGGVQLVFGLGGTPIGLEKTSWLAINFR